MHFFTVACWQAWLDFRPSWMKLAICSLSTGTPSDHQLFNFAQFQSPLAIKSNHTILKCLIETIAVEKANLHRHTDIWYIKRKWLAQLKISLNGELKFMRFECSMQIHSEPVEREDQINFPFEWKSINFSIHGFSLHQLRQFPKIEEPRCQS